jgi:hypothetical protein
MPKNRCGIGRRVSGLSILADRGTCYLHCFLHRSMIDWPIIRKSETVKPLLRVLWRAALEKTNVVAVRFRLSLVRAGFDLSRLFPGQIPTAPHRLRVGRYYGGPKRSLLGIDSMAGGGGL